MRVNSSTNAADKQIADGAHAIARDLNGPAGRITIDRAFARNLKFFGLCQERGMTWRQIAVTLHAAGAGRVNGLPFSENQLSSVVWRQCKRAQRQPGRGKDHNAPSCERGASKSAASPPAGFETPRRGDRGHSGAPEIGCVPDRSAGFDARPNSVSTPDASAARGSGAFRATLNRAAKLRQRTDDA